MKLPRGIAWAHAGKALLVAAAFAALAIRFIHIDLAPFNVDEPILQTVAQEQLRTGTWVKAGMGGSLGVVYGPFPIWFYGVVHWIFGPQAERSILALCVAVSLAHIGLAWTFMRLVKGGAVSFASALVWMASSPYLFFWSRTAWDNPLANASVAGALALFCLPPPMPLRHAIPLGLLLGTALSTHLMVLPLIGLLLAFACSDLRHSPLKTVLRIAVIVGGILIVNIPYFRFLAHQDIPPQPLKAFPLRAFTDHLVQPLRIATTSEIEYFFGGDWEDFAHSLGLGRPLLALTPWILVVAGFLATFGLVVPLFGSDASLRRTALLALATWVGYALFYPSRELGLHPHYQHPIWWVVPAGITSTLAFAARKNRAAHSIGVGMVWSVAFFNLWFDASWMDYIRERDGTRALSYSTTVGSQARAVHEICRDRPPPIFLRNETNLFPGSLSYLASIDPACAGKQLQVCAPSECPADNPASTVVLTYGPNLGGVLFLHPLSS